MAYWVGLLGIPVRKGNRIKHMEELSCDTVTTKVSMDPTGHSGPGMALQSYPKLEVSLNMPSGSWASSSLPPIFWQGLSYETSAGNTPNSCVPRGTKP